MRFYINKNGFKQAEFQGTIKDFGFKNIPEESEIRIYDRRTGLKNNGKIKTEYLKNNYQEYDVVVMYFRENVPIFILEDRRHA